MKKYWAGWLLVAGQILPLLVMWRFTGLVSQRWWVVLLQVLSGVPGLWAIWLLYWWRQYRLHPEPLANVKLITGGPYRLVRHPVYFTLLVYATITALDSGRLIMLMPVTVILASTLIKIRWEERRLCELIPEYEEYRHIVGALIPRLSIWASVV